jgi:hypothetical protein
MKNAHPPIPLSNNKMRTPLGPINWLGIFAMNLFKGCEHKAQQYVMAYAHVHHTTDVSDCRLNDYELCEATSEHRITSMGLETHLESRHRRLNLL